MPRRFGTPSRIGLPASLTAFALLGCGGATDDLPRQAVSGSVTLDGKPLEAGAITFDPAGPGQAVAGGALISGGSYSIAKAQGLTPGSYRVSIISSSGGGASPADAPGMPPKKAAKDPIPEKYNTKSTLKAEVKGGSNTIDFPLTGQ